MLEQYQKEIEKQENPEVVTKPEWEPTLKEILSKPEDSDLFGELLNREGQTDLTRKLTKGELDQQDIESLDGYRKEFLSTMERVKIVKESVSDEMVEAYTRNNPELQQVVGLIGTKAYKEIVKEKIKGLSIKDPWTFDFLAGAVEEKNRFTEDYYDPLDKEISDLCAKKNISPDAYMKALAIENESERKKELRSVVREGYGGIQKAIDWLSAGRWSKDRVGLIDSKKEEIDEMVGQMRHHQSSVGEFLSGLTQNDELRASLAKELVGDKEEKIPLQGFREAKGKIPTAKVYQDLWQQFKSEIKEWDTLEDAQKDLARDDFSKQMRESFSEGNKKKTGFWGSIFSIFFDSFVTTNRSNLN